MKQIPCKDCIALPACIIGPLDITTEIHKLYRLLDKCPLIYNYFQKNLDNDFEYIERSLEFILFMTNNSVRSINNHLRLFNNLLKVTGYYCIKNKRLVEIYYKSKYCPVCGRYID